MEVGVTFLEALKDRYISGGIGDDDEMFVVDKDSNATKVYMVGAEKIAGKLRYILVCSSNLCWYDDLRNKSFLQVKYSVYYTR